jgi:hypothetical protein
MNNIWVVNKSIHAPTENDFYIGRGSVLGNPYTSKILHETKAQFKCSSKEESIKSYKNYLNKKIENKDKNICDELNKIYLKSLETDIYLVCYCKPKMCHGDIIKTIITAKLIKFLMKK